MIKKGVKMEFFNLESGLYCVQSVFLTKFGHRLLLSLCAKQHTTESCLPISDLMFGEMNRNSILSK